ncbi:MAG TPA: alpha/beta hydrolase [Chthoniobacterales bacterium]|nr:alpha/beta hydrolase [Chthoniobacterales bacterium]
MTDLGFIHRFEPGKSKRTLLLLHGTGGDENALIELGRAIDPDAALLSPRGKILENGAPRFFRRLAEGVFDEADVVRRAAELCDFVDAAIAEYRIDAAQLTAVGYSNGANIAAAMLLLDKAIFKTAILFRAMVPLSNLERTPSLGGRRILLSAGKFDPIARADTVGALAGMLRQAGADVTVQIHAIGHQLTAEDVTAAHHWLSENS